MADGGGLSKEAFLRIAEEVGLDVNDPHMEDLYPFVQRIVPNAKAIEELDLTGMEPAVVFVPPGE
jgi:hypothetical protein